MDYLLGILVIIFGFALLLLPTLIALYTGHPRTKTIAAVNILTGWTILGWLVAMYLALSENESLP